MTSCPVSCKLQRPDARCINHFPFRGDELTQVLVILVTNGRFEVYAMHRNPSCEENLTKRLFAPRGPLDQDFPRFPRSGQRASGHT